MISAVPSLNRLEMTRFAKCTPTSPGSAISFNDPIHAG
jgi:hypothetical protein